MIPAIIIIAGVTAAVLRLIPPITLVIVVLASIPLALMALILLIIAIMPRECRFLGDYVELSTYLCRGRFRVVEVIDERSRLRDYSVIVPFGYRLYPVYNGWGYGGGIPGNVFVFSTSNCDNRWKLVKLTVSNGREFYAILCCGSNSNYL